MKDSLNELLKSEVCNQFGRNIISSTDCIELSDSIFSRTEFYLSPNTLRRLYGLVKTNFNPSSSTLRILSVYCGFRDIKDFKEKQIISTGEVANTGATRHREFIINILRSVPKLKATDESFIEFVKHTYNLLSGQADLGRQFLREIARSKNGRLFFSRFIDVDHLNSYYGEGLQFYVAACETSQERAAGNFLLAIKYWLLNDVNRLSNIVRVMEQSIQVAKCAKSMEHYRCASLLLENMIKLDSEHTLRDIVRGHTSSLKDYASEQFLSCKMLLFQTLMLTGNYNELLFCINEMLKHSRSIPDISIYAENINLFKAIAKLHLGDRKRALEIYQAINTADFYFLVRKLSMVQYLYLEAAIAGKTADTEQLDILIKSTGFIRLSTLNISIPVDIA